MTWRLLVVGVTLGATAAGGALAQHPMPPPERRMSWEDRQRLREQVQKGQMTRDEARQQYREERARRETDPSWQQRREQLQRDVQEANRDLQRR